MGMSIERIIKYLSSPICGDTVIGEEKQKEYDAHDSAVIILRKYQEIEKIVEDRNGKPPLTTLNEIIMVVEEWTYYKKKTRENKNEV